MPDVGLLDFLPSRSRLRVCVTLLLFIVLCIPMLAFAQCTLNSTSPSVTICTPTNGSTVTTPVQVIAGTTDNSHPVTAMKLYVDNQSVYTVSARQLSYTIQTLSAGQHNITVNAWDSSGAVFKSTAIITVSGTGTSPVSVAINPTSATLAPGATQQFSATVLNTSNTAVTWSVDGFINGNTTVGIITNSGLYTAPATSGTHNVVATSVADSTKSDTAIVTVTTSGGGGGGGGTCTPTSAAPSVTICSPAANSTVTSPVTVTAADSSTTPISKTLVYIDNVLVYQTTSTSVNTPLNVATGTHLLVVQFYNGAWIKKGENFTVSSGQTVGVTISPTSVTLAPGGTQQFSANVTGTTNTAVNWAVDGAPGGNSTVGTVDSSGLYTAPSTSGTHTVTATSQADSSQSASATVTVSSGQTIGITISPTSATLAPGGTQQFLANVTGTTNTAVNWSVDGTPGGNSTVGTVSSTGLYTAPSTTGTHTVTATSQADSSQSASAAVTVSSGSGGGGTCSPNAPAPSITICSPAANSTVTSPVTVTAADNSTKAITKTLIYIDNVLQYSTTASSVNVPLPASTGTHNLVVQFYNGTWIKQGEKFTVSSVQTIGITISPTSVTLAPGGTQQFSANVTGMTNTAVNWSVDGTPGGDSTLGTVDSTGLYTAPQTTGTHTITATSQADSSKSASATVTVSAAQPPPASGNYTMWKNDNQRTGQQRNETILTPANVNNLKVKFTATVDNEVFAQPLYLSGLSISGVTRNVVFVATENDTVYAFDANSGLLLWSKSLLMNGGTAVPQSNVGSTIGPVIGITGTPVIDPDTNTLYVVAETLESGSYIHRLHALDVTSGSEKLDGPVVISAPGSPAFASKEQLQRPALLLANGNVYVAFGSQGDYPPYNGWLISYSATTLSREAAWSVSPGGTGGGIWESGSGPSTDANGNIYVTAGNGSFNGTTQFSMSVVQLSPSLSVVDWFAPWNAVQQSANDKDVGSGGVLVVPDQTGPVPHELIACGKLPQVYVLNRDNMGQQGTNSDSQIVQELSNIVGGTSGTQASDHCFMTPAYWEGNLYFVGNNDVMKAFTLDPSTGKMSTSPTSQTSTSFSFPGAQPVVSSNGSSNGIVWVVSRANVLHAYDANNLASHLYAGPTMPFTKWAVPTVINGMVYVGTNGKLYAYGL